MESYRKPYIRETKSTWWTTRKAYIIYMIRELTAVFNLWVGVELLAMVIAAVTVAEPQAWIASLLQHPVVIILNICGLIACLFHIVTWYSIFPIGVRIFRSFKPDETRLVPRGLLSMSLYFVTIVASAIIILALTLA